MRTLGNILWHFPFLGFVSAIATYLWGLILTATVIAAPIGLGLMEFGKFLFAPFSRAMVRTSDLSIEQNKVWKTYSTIVMIVYFPFGLILCFLAIIQVGLLFLTIIGIPVALVVAKSLGTYLNPVRKKCVPQAVADELARRRAQAEIEKHLRPDRPEITQQERSSSIASDVVSPSSPTNSLHAIPAPMAAKASTEVGLTVSKSVEFEVKQKDRVINSRADPAAVIAQSRSQAASESPLASRAVSGISTWLVPGGIALLILAIGGVLYSQSVKRDAEQQEAQIRLVQEQERARQHEEEARRLAGRLARLEAEQKALAGRQQTQVEERQQQSTSAAGSSTQVSGGFPTIRVGDRYTYETLDLVNSKLNNVTTREIVDHSNGIYTQRNVNTKSGYTRFIRVDGSWNTLSAGTQAGVDVKFEPAFKYFEFPLYVGKTWESSSTETNAKTGLTRTHIIRGRVEGQERIAVQAGTFDTFKVVLNIETTDGNKRTSGTDVSWYAPTVRRTVRSEMESVESDTNRKGKRIVELLSFELR